MANVQTARRYEQPSADTDWRFKDLTILDRELFEGYFRRFPPENSEYTFTNLFIWNHHYNFQYAELNEALLLMARYKDRPWSLFPPIGGGDAYQTARQGFSWMKDRGLDPVMERVPWWMAKNHFEDRDDMEIEIDRDQSDYVYLASDLIGLRGRKFHGKRNHINKFSQLYNGKYRRINRENVSDCLALQEEWCNLRSCDEHPELKKEDMAVKTALENIDRLSFRAGAIFVDGRIQAFSIGEMLNKDTAVIHIEKANPEFEGIYALINQRFAMFEWMDYSFINREQDLGDEGLRKAKLSYKPHHMVDKYHVRWRK